MNKKQAIVLLEKAKKNSKERKFKQSYDLIFSIKGIDIKKTDQHVDFFVTLHYNKGKKSKVCGLVDTELKEESKEVLDETVPVENFKNYSDPKKAKKLAESFDFFVAQANVMTKVAASFGRVFGPRGKMPNPKLGCVVPPKTNLKPLYEKLQKTVRVSIKKGLTAQVAVGNEDSKDEEVIDNIITVYDQLVHHLPNEKNNIKAVYLKSTMGKPVMLGEEE